MVAGELCRGFFMEPPVRVPGFNLLTGLLRIQRQLPVFFRNERLDLLFPVNNHAPVSYTHLTLPTNREV